MSIRQSCPERLVQSLGVGVIPGAFGAVLAVLLRTGTPLTVRQIHGLISDAHSLRSTIGEAIDSNVKAVILFGSVARGEANLTSDIDLAAIASSSWDDRVKLQDTRPPETRQSVRCTRVHPRRIQSARRLGTCGDRYRPRWRRSGWQHAAGQA